MHAMIVAAAVLLAAPADNVGRYPDPDALSGFSQSQGASLDAFLGRIVLLEFFDPSDHVCVGSIPGLNELHAKYDGRGVTILGVTKADEGRTHGWIKEHAAAYPYCFDREGKLIADFGIAQFPAVALLDLEGKIVWEGVPSQVNDELLDKHLAGVISAPSWSWPKEAHGARKALESRQYGKALLEAGKIESGLGAEIRDALERMIAGRAAALAKLEEEGDYHGAVDAARLLGKSCAGLPAADEAKAAEKRIVGDPDKKQVLTAQAAVRKLRAREVHNRKDAEAVIDQLEKLAKKNEGNKAGAEARLYMMRLMGQWKSS